jgi:hypothetical protein
MQIGFWPHVRFSARSLGKAEATTMLKILSRAEKCLLIVAISILSCAENGCNGILESSFQLASESRLPSAITLPPGLTRADVSVTLNYYTNPLGSDAKFILRDRNGKKLAEINGKIQNLHPLQLKNPPQGFDPGYPSYEVVAANGITEVIEHRKMEPIFYVADDPAVRKEILADLKAK